MSSSLRADRRTDSQLVAACRAGDAAAWRAVIDRYRSLIFSVPLRMGLPVADAEDVFQNVSLKLCLHLDALRDADRLPAWLASIARQESLHLLRRRPTESLDATRELAQDDDSADALLKEERLLALQRGLAALAEDCRRLLELLYGPEPVPYADVAQRLGMPLGSIGPRRARCLERLKKTLMHLER